MFTSPVSSAEQIDVNPCPWGISTAIGSDSTKENLITLPATAGGASRWAWGDDIP